MKITALLCLFASLACAQVFRSDTTLIRAEALVEESGHVVTGLDAKDFVIMEEGHAQPVANFSADSGAVRLVILLDVSGSMERAARQLSQTATAALSALHPDDLVALMTFDKKATLRVPLTAERPAIAMGVSKLLGKPFGGSTDIYHSLADAAKYLGKSTTAPNVILAITDNAARADTTEAATLRELWDDSVSADALVVSSAPLWDDKISQSLGGLKLQDVRRIASQTGGVVQQSPDVAGTFGVMLERSRTRYSLYFRQPDDAAAGTMRHLKIDLSPAARAQHPAAVVRARTAYYAE